MLAAVFLIAGTAHASDVKLNVSISSPVLLSGVTQKAYLKVGLTGLPIQERERRTPVNVAIVLDRSGSMSGEKIWKAREAAKMAIGRLGPEDIVSVVAYNHNVDVLVPATRVSDRDEIYRTIDRLDASGNTALFAGVSKGSHEVRKFMEENQVNRVILLSDGLANVGPSSTGELSDLGISLGKEGISVTTIGLGTGYNEDLMAALAAASDGNHAFAETADDLARIFTYEFGDLLSVIARDIEIEINCGPGIRPIRVLGRDAEVYGHKVVARLNQVYANQEKYLLIEVEVPASDEGSQRQVASVNVRYSNTLSRIREVQTGQVEVSFSGSRENVEKNVNRSVMISTVDLEANESTKRAMRLRDEGRIPEAQKELKAGADKLNAYGRIYNEPKLKARGAAASKAVDDLSNGDWNVTRKKMRKQAHEVDQQQAW